MKIIEPSVHILNPPDYNSVLRHIEAAAITCYQSEAKDSFPEPFIQRLIKNVHEAVIEHASISVRFICDRGVSHELVRHRIASYSQESTRFCNYSGDKFGSGISFIKPCFWNPESRDPEDRTQFKAWETAMRTTEDAYLYLISRGSTPQEARSVLPNSLKTDIVVTANIREWRHIFKERCQSAAHPQMRQSMIPVLGLFMDLYPVFFNDLSGLYTEGFNHFVSKGWQLAEVKNA